MKWLRFWFATMLAWLFVCFNLERIEPAVALSMPVAVWLASVALVIIYFRRVRRLGWNGLLAVSLGILAAIKWYTGQPMLSGPMPLGAFDWLAVALTTALSQYVALCIGHFEEAATDVVLRHHGQPPSRFVDAQPEMYRELRRSRRHGRPVALLTVAAEPHSVETARNRLLEQIQRESIEQYASACMAELIAAQVSDCDLVTERDDHFVVLLPETDQQAAHSFRDRLVSVAEKKLGMKLRVGLSTFPDQDVTLVGLLEHAVAQMKARNGHALHPEHLPGSGNGKPKTVVR